MKKRSLHRADDKAGTAHIYVVVKYTVYPHTFNGCISPFHFSMSNITARRENPETGMYESVSHDLVESSSFYSCQLMTGARGYLFPSKI